MGFFIAGSSIEAMNGLYVPLGERDDSLPHEGIRTWGNLGSPWVVANVDTRRYPPGQPALGGKPMEWVIYDEEGRARFAHEGGLYLPGAGRRPLGGVCARWAVFVGFGQLVCLLSSVSALGSVCAMVGSVCVC